jgi:hypothetical protein
MASIMRKFYAATAKAIDAIPLGEETKVFIGVSIIIGYSTYSVFGSEAHYRARARTALSDLIHRHSAEPAKKPGHDLASSEKPEAFRNETKRDLEDEKRKAKERIALKHKIASEKSAGEVLT